MDGFGVSFVKERVIDGYVIEGFFESEGYIVVDDEGVDFVEEVVD